MDDTITLYDVIDVRKTTLLNYIMDLNPTGTITDMRETFIKSCVSSCVLCYILGVGDRHTENILINKWGDLIHIDFSYLLGEDPKHVYTLQTGVPILLKGLLWPTTPTINLLHRSPPTNGKEETRLIMVLDQVIDPEDEF